MTQLDELVERERNWQRWGAEDELGAANLLTPERVCEAAKLIRNGRIFSLSLPVAEKGTPTMPGRPPMQHFMRRTGADYAAGVRRKGGFQSVDDVIMLSTHGTTHMDALSHIADKGQIFNGYPLAGIKSNGAEKLGIGNLSHLAGRGVLLDLCKLHGVDRLEKGEVISADDLIACARAQNVTVTAGTILLLRTGWLGTFRNDGAEAFFAGEPGIGLDAAIWIADQDVVAVGADNFAVEVIPTDISQPAPVHRYLLRDCGIYLMELFQLDELAAHGIYEFFFVAAPLQIERGVGSPLNPLAIT